MVLFFFLVGLMLVISGIRGTNKDLVEVLRDDFTGPNNFVFWVLAMAILAALGSVKSIRPVTQGFLVLVIIVIFLRNDNLITKFVTQIRNGTSGR